MARPMERRGRCGISMMPSPISEAKRWCAAVAKQFMLQYHSGQPDADGAFTLRISRVFPQARSAHSEYRLFHPRSGRNGMKDSFIGVTFVEIKFLEMGRDRLRDLGNAQAVVAVDDDASPRAITLPSSRSSTGSSTWRSSSMMEPLVRSSTSRSGISRWPKRSSTLSSTSMTSFRFERVDRWSCRGGTAAGRRRSGRVRNLPSK